MLREERYLINGAVVLDVRLDEPETECIACGAEPIPKRFGLPMVEGEIVPVEYTGEWAGFDCCEGCHRAYAAGGPDGVARRVASLTPTPTAGAARRGA